MGFPVDMGVLLNLVTGRHDGKPGREIVLRLKGPKIFGKSG
jgi:hypothetical protein